MGDLSGILWINNNSSNGTSSRTINNCIVSEWNANFRIWYFTYNPSFAPIYSIHLVVNNCTNFYDSKHSIWIRCESVQCRIGAKMVRLDVANNSKRWISLLRACGMLSFKSLRWIFHFVCPKRWTGCCTLIRCNKIALLWLQYTQ